MGGLGSGKFLSGGNGKDRVEDYNAMDILMLWRQEALSPNCSWTLNFGQPGGNTSRVYGIAEGREIRLSYQYRTHDGSWKANEQFVALAFTPCNYGGQRPWFVCPGKSGQDCGQRVRYLYLKDNTFSCRTCQDLAYECQRLGNTSRLLQRARRIRQRLLHKVPEPQRGDWPDALRPGYHVPHPPGMSSRRFWRLAYQVRDLEMAAFDASAAWMEKNRASWARAYPDHPPDPSPPQSCSAKWPD